MTVSAEGLPFIDTSMSFSGPIEGRARVDVADWSRTNMALEPHGLRLFDARGIAAGLSLDREGFTLTRHECGLTAASGMAGEGPRVPGVRRRVPARVVRREPGPAPADRIAQARQRGGRGLTLCDASSMSAADCIVFDAAMREPYDEPGNQFESQFARFNPAQRWYYFSDLRADELIVFKGFDSDPARDAQPLHNSIDLPGGAPRVSVEARFFAFFD
jgi:hypothetical protein